MRRELFLSLAGVAMLVAFASNASAATFTWNGTSATWSAGGTGWVEGAYPANGSAADTEALFDATGSAQLSPSVSGTVEANKLGFGLDDYSISGGTIDLNGTTPTITVDPGFFAEIGSTIGGTSGLTKAGTGELVLSGVNTYSGATTVTALCVIGW